MCAPGCTCARVTLRMGMVKDRSGFLLSLRENGTHFCGLVAPDTIEKGMRKVKCAWGNEEEKER